MIGIYFRIHDSVTCQMSHDSMMLKPSKIVLLSRFHVYSSFTAENILSQVSIIYLKSVSLSVSRRSQTAGRNSCSIVSGNVSNCSHRLTVYPVTSSRQFGLAFFYTRKTLIKLSRRAVPEQVSIEWPSDGRK